jgi:hypothetical protein
MHAKIETSHVCWGPITVTYSDFPDLIQLHRDLNPATPHLEAFGVRLFKQDFRLDDAIVFILAVRCWGGFYGPRIADVTLRKHKPKAVHEALVSAIRLLQDSKLDAALGETEAAALSLVSDGTGLSTSWGSKLLRFLCPERCPVLDKNLAVRLGYVLPSPGDKPDPKDYTRFTADCAHVADALRKNNVANPFRTESGEWLRADVETAVFARVMEWRSIQQVAKP